MNGFIDTLLFLGEIDTAEKRLNVSRFNKLGDVRDSVSDEFKKYYKPSDIVPNYIDSLLKADEANKMYKRRELNLKINFVILLLGVWKVLLEGDILQFPTYHDIFLLIGLKNILRNIRIQIIGIIIRICMNKYSLSQHFFENFIIKLPFSRPF